MIIKNNYGYEGMNMKRNLVLKSVIEIMFSSVNIAINDLFE
jgi:hypothetical protein